MFFFFCVLAGPCKIILSKVMRNVFETRFRLQFKDDRVSCWFHRRRDD